MIKLDHITKTFTDKTREVKAVKDVSLTIPKGSIYGIIGYSGAGKSTLVRCINLLERPDTGQVIVEGVDLMSLNDRDLRQERSKIGMIFQHFNLFDSRTVYDNVAFPLRYHKLSKDEINQRVTELLQLVDIEDKKAAYPSQLSGGQKQRVAIARALASNPHILLCDEATSALDPQTTQNILELLTKLNKTLDLTIVVITHEMRVVKEICDYVGVMEDGYLLETGPIIDIFTNPQHQQTVNFINTTTNYTKVKELLSDKKINVENYQQVLKLDFVGSVTKEAIIAKLSSKFEVEASIIYANIEAIQDEVIGSMLVILDGSRQKEAIEYLKESNVHVEVIKEVV